LFALIGDLGDVKKQGKLQTKKGKCNINMVLAVTTRNQVSEANAFKEKETKQNKIVTN
jgi:hypothetical protein